MDRLALVLNETKTLCLAYALIPNHFHLLLRTGDRPIATSMRRLLTSHAVNFNKKYKRTGHLFQNRYKDIVCQEDAYLLELVRYINLNPLRAGVVNDIEHLDKFTFCSHSRLIKNSAPQSWFGKDEILSLFANSEQKAIRKYRLFLLDGVGRQEVQDMEGGGLKRSLKNLEVSKEERLAYDDRILGDSDFVLDLIKREDQMIKPAETCPDLSALIDRALKIFDLNEAQLAGSFKSAKVTRARALVTFIATQELGISAAAVARRFRLNRSSTTRLIEKGRQIATDNKGI